MTLTIGSLFSGTAGLDRGVGMVLPTRTIWHSDIKPAAVKLLAHRFPDVPNLGDITTVDWASVERPDIITGGFPCTDISAAGKQAGLIRYGDGKTRSGLWAEMCRAIDILRPSLVVAENVRALTSVRADSDVEPCPWCLGDPAPDDALRALGAVLGDLADRGFDAEWVGLRAADVGAPHGRFRIFIVAWPAPDTIGGGRNGWAPHAGRGPLGREVAARDRAGNLAALHPDGVAGPQGRSQQGRPGAVDEPGSDPTVRWTVRAHAAADAAGSRRAEGQDGGAGRGDAGTRTRSGEPQRSDRERRVAADTDAGRREVGAELNGHAVRADDGPLQGHPDRHPSSTAPHADRRPLRFEPVSEFRRSDQAVAGHDVQWGPYGPAIRRWGSVLGRPAPSPTELGAKGGQRLSPWLTEWLMGLPEGWICDVPGLSRSDKLSLAGDGVVPQQAAEALRRMLPMVGSAAA